MINLLLFTSSLIMIVLYITSDRTYNWFIDALFGLSVGAQAFIISALMDYLGELWL